MDKFGVPRKINRHVLRALYQQNSADLFQICDLVNLSMRNNNPVRDLTGAIRQSLQNMVQLGVISKRRFKFYLPTPKHIKSKRNRKSTASNNSLTLRSRNDLLPRTRLMSGNFNMDMGSLQNRNPGDETPKNEKDETERNYSLHMLFKNEDFVEVSNFKIVQSQSQQTHESKKVSSDTKQESNDQNTEETQDINKEEDRHLDPPRDSSNNEIMIEDEVRKEQPNSTDSSKSPSTVKKEI